MTSWTQVKLEWTNGYEALLNLPRDWQPNAALSRITVLEDDVPTFVAEILPDDADEPEVQDTADELEYVHER